MYWSLAAPLAENRIIEYKLRFYHHLVNLNNEAVAFKIYQKQRNLRLGLVKECLEFLAVLNIRESEVTSMSKAQWSKHLRTKVKEKDRCDLLEKMKPYKKFNYFNRKDEPFEMKEYFKVLKLEDCRLKFSIESEMTRTVKTHFFSDKQFASQLWICENCETSTDSVPHIKVCPSLAYLRENRDLDCDFQLTEYFKEVIGLRVHKNEE